MFAAQFLHNLTMLEEGVGQLPAKVIAVLVTKANLVEILLSILEAMGPIRSKG